MDHGEAVVDISNVAQGYVALRYKGSAKKISVEVIGKNNKVYKYFIERTKEPTYFPLTSGMVHIRSLYMKMCRTMNTVF